MLAKKDGRARNRAENDLDGLSQLVDDARAALLLGDEEMMDRLLAQVQPRLLRRGVVLGAVRDRHGKPIDLGIVVVPSPRYGADWRRAIPSSCIAHTIAAILVVQEDGSLDAVKNRFGPPGPIPVRALPAGMPAMEPGLRASRAIAAAAADALQVLRL